jgi:hypothetical protein
MTTDDRDPEREFWETEYEQWEAEQDDEFNFDMSEAFDD